MKEGDSIQVYNLDQAATTRVLPEAIAEAVKYMDEYYYNPSALYYGADEVHMAVEGARNRFADILGVKPNEIIFTSGGSEGNCLAIDGCDNPILVTTNVEHKSIATDKNFDRVELQVDENGVITQKEIDTLYPLLKNLWGITVSIQHVNNETGVVQPITEIFDKLKELLPEKTIYHCDGTQAIGHIPIKEIRRVIQSCDMYSFSGHKFGAPKGIGILVKKEHVKLESLIHGTQNYKVRGGTENVPGIMSMLVAFEHAVETCTDESICKNQEVREKLFNGLNNLTPVNKTIDDNKAIVVPNILSVRFEDRNISGEALIGFLSALKVYCSLGSACNAGQDGTSYVLQALGIEEEDALRTIRISFPDGLTDDDIETILIRFKIAIEALKRARE